MLSPAERFYNDLPSDEQSHWVSLLKSCPAKTQLDTVSYAAYLHHPVTYLVCENDQALPAFLQRKMMDDVEGANKGLVFEREGCGAGHSPFLSQLDVLLGVVQRIAE